MELKESFQARKTLNFTDLSEYRGLYLKKGAKRSLNAIDDSLFSIGRSLTIA
jgi:hypothetical protein